MRQRGKKVEMIWIEEGAQRHHVELRFDKEHGDFFAKFGDIELSAATFPELKAKLQERAKLLVGYEYKWYIETRFSVQQGGINHSWGQDWDDLDNNDDPLVGLHFAFQVIERSQAVKTDERDYRMKSWWLHMERPVEEIDGKLQPEGKHVAKRTNIDKGESPDHTDVIEFTPERYAKLLAIRTGLRELARRLHEVIGGEPNQVVKALDSLKAQPLALAAESTIGSDKPCKVRFRDGGTTYVCKLDRKHAGGHSIHGAGK